MCGLSRTGLGHITYQRFVASVLAAMSTKGDHEVLPTQREAPVWRASGDAGGRRGGETRGNSRERGRADSHQAAEALSKVAAGAGVVAAAARSTRSRIRSRSESASPRRSISARTPSNPVQPEPYQPSHSLSRFIPVQD